ncbi:MAG: zinc dependent phospholipase C family protein [Erysipelotrichaceae bacterium]
MPNIITHQIFAQQVLLNIKQTSILNIINKSEHIYEIGSNGPDFLFFHNSKPWQLLGSHEISKIGSKLHTANINLFYKSLIDTIKEEKDLKLKEDMIAYTFGHLVHWALDVITHPYIFYHTGNCKGDSAGYHHKFESMLDTIMLDKFKHKTIKHYTYYNIAKTNINDKRVIAKLYVPATLNALNITITNNDIYKALSDWYENTHLLYDKNGWKFKTLTKIEKIIKSKNLISGNIVLNDKDYTYDIMNEKHSVWYNPCTKEPSTKSFIELFNEGIALATSCIELLYRSVESGEDVYSLLELIGDRAYDTGICNNAKMKYFNIIYKE